VKSEKYKYYFFCFIIIFIYSCSDIPKDIPKVFNNSQEMYQAIMQLKNKNKIVDNIEIFLKQYPNDVKKDFLINYLMITLWKLDDYFEIIDKGLLYIEGMKEPKMINSTSSIIIDAFLKENKKKEAEAFAEKIFLKAGDAKEKYYAGLNLILLYAPEKALDIVEKLLKYKYPEPQECYLFFLKGNILCSNGDYQNGLKFITDEIIDSLGSENIQSKAVIFVTHIWYKYKDIKKAINYLSGKIVKYRNSRFLGHYYNTLGDLEFENKNYDRAEFCYKSVLKCPKIKMQVVVYEEDYDMDNGETLDASESQKTVSSWKYAEKKLDELKTFLK